jgi:hypothetical protein
MEHACTANKVGIYIEDSGRITIEDFWWEGTGTTNMIHIKDGNWATEIKGKTIASSPGGKIKIENSEVFLQNYSGEETLIGDSPVDADLWHLLDIDSTSTVVINGLESKRGDDTILVDNPNIYIQPTMLKSVIDQSLTDQSAIKSQTCISSENMFVNSSFESAEWGWTWTGNAPNTKSFESSQVGPGLMAHYTWDTNDPDGCNLKQRVAQVIPASWDDGWLTLSYKVKVVKGAGNTAAAWVDAYVNGGGHTGYQLGRINAGIGWCVQSVTFKLTTTGGALDVGIAFEAGEQDDEVFIDDMTLSFSHENTLGAGKFGAIELSGFSTVAGVGRTTYNSLTYGVAAPTSGTWKDGDIVFNIAPVAGATIGWVCTTAGTPGTWKTWGAITA